MRNKDRDWITGIDWSPVALCAHMGDMVCEQAGVF